MNAEPKAKKVRVCKRCGAEKPLEDYPRNSGCIDGREPRCKACIAEIRRKAWKEKSGKKTKVLGVTVARARKRRQEIRPKPVTSQAVVAVPDMVSEVKNLVDAHWKYIQNLLSTHGQKDLAVIEYHYRTAFIHGYKHGVESMEVA